MKYLIRFLFFIVGGVFIQQSSMANGSTCRFSDEKMEVFTLAYFGMQELNQKSGYKDIRPVLIWWEKSDDEDAGLKRKFLDPRDDIFKASKEILRGSTVNTVEAYALFWQDIMVGGTVEKEKILRINAGYSGGNGFEVYYSLRQPANSTQIEVGCSVNLLNI